MIGQLFLLRSSVNLMGDMLDTPDCFWDLEQWESVYSTSREYYDLDKRIEIINQRVDLIKEMYDMLNDEM